jgi:phosphonate transport system permease protein
MTSPSGLVADTGFSAWQTHVHKRRVSSAVLLVATLAVLAWCFYDTILFDTDWARMAANGVGTAAGRFFAIDWSLLPKLVVPAIETLMIATLGTILGCVFSLPVAWLGAANVTPSKAIAYPVGRFLMVLSRSIHEIIWALLFVGAVGLGALPGILAVAMRSVGFISKITAEAIENIDNKPVEAIRAVGGNQFQVMYFGIVPQILPVIIGTIIFEWDINIRRSAIMGLVGAGGLGLLFFRQMAMFNYGGVTLVVLTVLVLVALGEVVSHYARKAVI